MLDSDLANIGVGIVADVSGLKKIGEEAEKTGKKLKSEGKKAEKSYEGFEKRMRRVSDTFNEIGSQLTMKITAPIVAVTAVSTKFAMDFESSFAGVRKTVEATEAEFEALSQGIRDMAKRIPIDVNELNSVAEAAGQLGIQKENILDFTETMSLLGVTTNMAAGEAATTLARFANITGMSQKNFDRLGSSIVYLGNNFATTESEVADFSLRIAGAGATVGLTEPQILGFAAALSSLGLEAQAGGTAISKVMIEIAAAVDKGGESLGQFASVAEMGVADFQKLFKEDAASAVIAFIEGLGRMEERGGSVLGVLEQMGLTEVRLRDALLRLAGATDLLSKGVRDSTKAWEENNALTEEAEKRFQTTAMQLKLLWNQVKDVGITFGSALLPMVQKAIELLQGLLPKVEAAATWFGNLSEMSKLLIAAFFGIVAAIGPVMLVIGGVIALLAVPFIAVIAKAIAILAALTIAGVAIVENWEEIKSAFSRTWETLKTDFLGVKNAVIGIWEDLTEGLKNLWDGFVSWLEDTIPGLKGAFDKIRGWIDETNEHSRKVMEASIKRANKIAKERKEALENAAPSPFQVEMADQKMGSNTIVPPTVMRAGIALMTDYGNSIKGTQTQMSELGEVTFTTGEEVKKTTEEAKKGEEGLNDLGGGAGGAGDAIKDLNESLAEQNAELVNSIRLIGLEGKERIKMETILLKEKGVKAELAEANEALRLAEYDRTTQAEFVKSIDDQINKMKQQRHELFLTGEALIDYRIKLMEADAAAKGLSDEGMEKVREKLNELRKEMRLFSAGQEMKKWMEDNVSRWIDPFTKQLVRIPQETKKQTNEALTAVQAFAADVAGNINDSFASLINQGLKGNFDSMKDFWDSTLSAMRESFSQFLSAIITNPIRLSLEAVLNNEEGKGYQVGDITRGVGNALKKIPGVDKVMDKLTDTLGSFAKAIPVIGDIAAGVLAAAPMILGMFKKTPRLDVEFDSIKTEVGRRAAFVSELLDDEMLQEIVDISVKRKAGLGVGGSDAIKKILSEAIQGAVNNLLDIIHKLPSDMARRIEERLLSTPLDVDTTVGGERLFEFDAKGKKIGEKFNALINGEIQAKFLFAVDDALQFMFEELGVLPELAADFLAQKFEEFENAGSREARAVVGQEVLAALNAYVDAFNIVDGNFGDVTQEGVESLKRLSEELGFGTVPSLEELRASLKTLIETADIDPSVIEKYVELRKLIVQMVTDLSQGIQETIASIQGISSAFGLGANVSGAAAEAIAMLEEFYQTNKDSLSIEEREGILNEIASLNQTLANEQVANAQRQQQAMAEGQRRAIQGQIDQQRVLRDQQEKVFTERLSQLGAELEHAQMMERVNQSLRDDLQSLMFSDASPLTGVEKLNRIVGEIGSLESRLAGAAPGEEQAAIIGKIQELQKEAVRIAGEEFGVGSAEQRAIFEQTVTRLEGLIAITDAHGRTAEQIQASIEALNEKRNQVLEGIDARIEGLESSLSSVGASQVDATNAVSQDVRDRAQMIVDELGGILQEKLDLLEEATSGSEGKLASVEEINQEMLVVQRSQLDQLNVIAQAVQGATGGAAGSAGSTGGGGSGSGGSGGQGEVLNPFSPFYTGMAKGGVIAEPIAGLGLWTGRSFAFGEGGAEEAVLPMKSLEKMNELVNRMHGGAIGSLAGRVIDRPASREGVKDTLEIVVKGDTSEEFMQAVAESARRGALRKVIVKKSQGSISARGGR